jgi:formiminotetrahydrofolate cyclodeaminase
MSIRPVDTLPELTFAELLDRVAAKSPTPGGGAVASAVGALAAALAQMVVNYSLGKKNLAPHQPQLESDLADLERAGRLMLDLAAEDAAAYASVNELSRLPEGDARRVRDLPAATQASVDAPLATIAASLALLRRFEALAARTNRHLRSDLAIAAILAHAAARASRWNVLVNAPGLPAPARDRTLTHAADMVNQAGELTSRVEALCDHAPAGGSA